MGILILLLTLGWFHAVGAEMAACRPGIDAWDTPQCARLVPVDVRRGFHQ